VSSLSRSHPSLLRAWLVAAGVLLAAALAQPALAADTQPPTAPQIDAGAVSQQTIAVSWTAASDDVGVVGYDVYRDGSLWMRLGNTTQIVDSDVPPLAQVAYRVRALDAAGNRSAFSNTAYAYSWFGDDFEHGLARWDNTGLVAQSRLVFDGTGAARARSTGAPAGAVIHGASPFGFAYARLHVYVRSQDASPVDLIGFRTASGAQIFSVLRTGDGHVAIRLARGQIVTSSVVLPAGGWHELFVGESTKRWGNVPRTDVSLDGVPIAELTGPRAVGGGLGIGQVVLGDLSGGHAFDIAFDDLGVGTDPTVF
jgi:hypothetical protein